MKHNARAYTIIEVLIVLAVSGILLVSVAALFNGRGGETEFTQGVQDARADMQTKIDSVSTNITSNFQQHSCSVNTALAPPRAQLGIGTSNVGANQSCLLLGKAFEALPGSTSIYVYTVLGNRQVYASGTPISTVSSFSDADPTPAVSPYDLTEVYQLNGGLKVRSASSNLVGYYTDLSGSIDNTNGSEVLLNKSYNYGSNNSPGDRNQVKSCIEGSCSISDITSWQVCFQDSSNSQRIALLTVNSSSSGITTAIKFDDCSPLS